MFSLFFTPQKAVTDFQMVAACDIEKYNRFFHYMLDAGVYFAPSAFESAFVSGAHREAEIKATLAAASTAFAKLKK